MALDGRVEELLSAYLMGDIQPEERAAVEKLLAEKPELRALVKDLKDLRELLKHGERKVSPQMVETLRYRVMSELKQHARFVSVPALLAATLKGDVTPQERETVENYLQTHPSAQRELETLRKLDGMLAQGKLDATPELSDKLLARLKAKLPAEALNTPAVPAPAVRAAASSATMLRPSVRVFTAKQNVVRRNAVWFATAAAVAVTVTLGVVIVRSLNGNPEPDNTIVNHLPKTPENTNNGEVVVAPENKLPLIPNPIVREQQPPVAPAPHVVENTPVAPQQRTPEPIDPQVRRNDTVVNKTPEPRTTPDAPVKQPPIVAQQAPRNNDAPVAPPQVANNAPRDNSGVAIPNTVINNNPALTPDSPPSVASNVPATNTPVGPSNNEPPRTATQDTPDVNQAQGSTAVVLTVKDGTVQGRNADNQTVNLQANAQVASGTEVITDRGRIALQLPGDGRLWINRGSNVQLTMKNRNTTVTLNSGEIAYRAPSSGSLTVIVNGVQLVRDAKSVDAKLSGKQLTVFGMDKTASVGQKNKAVTITAGTKAVVTLDSDELPLKEAGAPDNWRSGLDGGDDTPPKTTTSEAKKQKRRS